MNLILRRINPQRPDLPTQRARILRLDILKRTIRIRKQIRRHRRRLLELRDRPFPLLNTLIQSLFGLVFGREGGGGGGDAGHVGERDGVFAGDHGDAEGGFEEGLVPTGEGFAGGGWLDGDVEE